MMTSKEYTEKRGTHCPGCGSTVAIEAGRIDIDGGYASQEVSCMNCRLIWLDEYRLTGFEVIEVRPDEAE